jgi:hypothetical protein
MLYCRIKLAYSTRRGFDDAREAVEAIRTINADYLHHTSAAREIAREYFDARRPPDQMAEVMGL